jgi:hypothetical protein
MIGTAIIAGQDGWIGGVEEYVIGSLMISFGLTILAFGTWGARMLPRAVPVLWVLSTVVGVGGFAAGGNAVTFQIAGTAFGCAFILAGLRIWSNQGREIERV